MKFAPKEYQQQGEISPIDSCVVPLL